VTERVFEPALLSVSRLLTVSLTQLAKSILFVRVTLVHGSSSQLRKRQCRVMLPLRGEIWGVTLAVGLSLPQKLDFCCTPLAPAPHVLEHRLSGG